MMLLFGFVFSVIGMFLGVMYNWIAGAVFLMFGLVMIIYPITEGVADWVQDNVVEGNFGKDKEEKKDESRRV